MQAADSIELLLHIALPTRRSTSAFSRHGSKHAKRGLPNVADLLTVNGTALAVTATSPLTGKSHSVVIDAGSMQGGISGSTINIAINGKRALNDSAPASPALPTPTAPSPSSDAAQHHNVYINAAGSAGIVNSTLNINLNSVKRRTPKAMTNPKSTPAIISSAKSSIFTPAAALQVAPTEIHKVNPKNAVVAKRNARRQVGFVTDLAAEQSAYAAGVAALPTLTAAAATATNAMQLMLDAIKAAATTATTTSTPISTLAINPLSFATSSAPLATGLPDVVVTLTLHAGSKGYAPLPTPSQGAAFP